MPLTTVPTFTAGVLHASDLNNVGNDVNMLLAPPRWRAYTADTTTNNFPSATAQVVHWELESWDQCFDGSTVHLTTPSGSNSYVTIAVAGLYAVRARVGSAATTGNVQVWICRGTTGATPGTSLGTIWEMTAQEASATSITECNTEISCAVGDVLWVVYRQASGSVQAILPATYANSFTGRWVASS